MSIALDPLPVRIRTVRTLADFRRCEDLQKVAWGFEDLDVVPLPMFVVAVHTAGVVLGAYSGDRLIGFVYSLPARVHGEWVQYSHMLAVTPEFRRRGIGLRLKRAQGRAAARIGFHTIVWTFDPLQARNAALNLRRLGATARDYEVDYYGETSSPLHRGLATDRLLAIWGTGRRRRRHGWNPVDAPFIYDCSKIGALGERAFRIAIPPSIDEFKLDDPQGARQRQLQLRTVFRTAFRRGFEAVDFDLKTSSYLLMRRPRR